MLKITPGFPQRIPANFPQSIPTIFPKLLLVQKRFQVIHTSPTILAIYHNAKKCTTCLQTSPSELSINDIIRSKFFTSSWPGEDYAYNLASPSLDDPMSAATASMGNLSMTMTALGSSSERIRFNEAPGPSQDPLGYNEASGSSRDLPRDTEKSAERIEPKKSKSSRESKTKEKHPKKHDRSETPPEKQQSSKRQTGGEPRTYPPLLPKERK